MKPAPILAILMLIALFLPWVSFGVAGVSGFDILRATFEADGATGGMIDPSQMGDDAWLLYVFYAIPVGAVLTLLLGFQSAGAGRFFALLTGLAPWAIGIYTYLQISGQAGAEEIFEYLGIGAYATLLVGLLMILCGLGAFGSGRR